MTLTGMFTPSELKQGDTVYTVDAWSGKEWPATVVKTTPATITVDVYPAPRTFRRREDTYWNGSDYIMVAA